MSFRFAFIVLALSCASAWGGGSIFDDNYVPPKDPVENRPAKAPEPQPVRPSDPAPAPQQPDAPAQPANPPAQPADSPASPADLAQPQNGRPGTADPAPTPIARPTVFATPYDQLLNAIDVATESLHKEEHEMDHKLEADPAYVAARDRAEAEANKGPDTPIAIRFAKMREAAIAKNPKYLEARRYLSMLTRLKDKYHNGVQAKQIRTQEQFLDDIKVAVERRGLIEGMSFQEACKSARKPTVLVSQSGKTKTYRWLIKGQTGIVHTVFRDAFGRMRQQDEPTYGLLGYVEGVFEDDYLVSFSRGK